MKKRSTNAIDRRHFMKMVLGSTALSQFGLLSSARASAPVFSDYKALVCIFLHGGNDSFNMLIPTSSNAHQGYDPYAAIRSSLAVSDQNLTIENLHNRNLGAGTTNPYYAGGLEDQSYLSGLYGLSHKGIDLGVNAVMPELAHLLDSQRASIVANAGTLVRPVVRDEVLNNSADLPLFLFAHNHQQRILQTGQAHTLEDIGWAGKISDYWQGINNSSTLGLNISFAGADRLFIGEQTSPLILKPGNSIPNYSGMSIGGGHRQDDRISLFRALQGQQNISGSGNLDFGAANTYATDDPYEVLYAKLAGNSFETFDHLYKVWNNNDVNYETRGSYGESLFGIPTAEDLGFSNDISGSLIRQLESVAKMIHLSASGAFESTPFNRQIFLVSLGGFDTHAEQSTKHPLLLRELSLGLWKFQQAMEELGHANQVNTFTMSDFGRTMSNNGDGTDHAWGAHHLLMGGDGSGSSGSLRGGTMFGELPDITLAGNGDHGDKGRIIPTTSQDQLNATLCNWFGVDSSILREIFPNLDNFERQDGGVFIPEMFYG